MAYRCRLYSGISQVDPTVWGELRRHGSAGFFADARFLAVTESTMAHTGRYWYVIFEDESGRPVAAACLCTFTVELDTLSDAQNRVLIGAVNRLLPGLLRVKVLLCGLPVSTGAGHLFLAPGADPAEVLGPLDGLLTRLARREGAAFLAFKEFTGDECRRMTLLERLGWRRIESLVEHCFPTGFPDFAAYTAALKSHYRYLINKSRRRFAKAGLRIEVPPDPRDVLPLFTDEVHRLYLNVADRAEAKLEVLPAEFFRELARRMPDSVEYTLVRKGDRVAGFMSALHGEGAYHSLYIGVDYRLNADADLYFNLMCAGAGNGLRRGASEIRMGQTADAFKTRLGCRPKPLFLFVRGAGPVSGLILRTCAGLIFPRPRLEPHDVFRGSGE